MQSYNANYTNDTYFHMNYEINKIQFFNGVSCWPLFDLI